MYRLILSRSAAAAAGVLALGLVSLFAETPAQAQVATGPATQPVSSSRPLSVYGAPAMTLSGRRLPGNGYNPGPAEGRAPGRDWSTGRQVPLAKPWLRPLPR